MPAEDEEYELTPHRQLEELKSEIEKLRQIPTQVSTKSSANLQESVDHLNEAVSELLGMFKYVKDNPDNSESDGHHEIMRKLDTLIDENRKIAQGIVSLAEMVRKLSAQSKQRPMQYSNSSSIGSIPPPLRAPPGMIQSPPSIPGAMPSGMPQGQRTMGQGPQSFGMPQGQMQQSFQQPIPSMQPFPPVGPSAGNSSMPPPPFSPGSSSQQQSNTEKKKGLFGF